MLADSINLSRGNGGWQCLSSKKDSTLDACDGNWLSGSRLEGRGDGESLWQISGEQTNLAKPNGPSFGVAFLLHRNSHPESIADMATICCDRMKYDLSQTCNMHPNRYDCPDMLVAKLKGRYGLIVHDGGHSVIIINFCPWCGTRLTSKSKSKSK
jgi:hypothetical protein